MERVKILKVLVGVVGSGLGCHLLEKEKEIVSVREKERVVSCPVLQLSSADESNGGQTGDGHRRTKCISFILVPLTQSVGVGAQTSINVYYW